MEVVEFSVWFWYSICIHEILFKSVSMPSQVVKDCGIALEHKGYFVAFAESATAGRMASEFALLLQSRKILKEGVVCYDACIKEGLLKVPKELIDKFTPESAEVTEALAQNIAKLISSDVQVAVTGLTRRGGSENSSKPVGTMFLHVLIKGNPFRFRAVFDGSPKEIILQTISQAAKLILNELLESN